MAQMTMIQAITDALRTELKNNENVLLFGEDVALPEAYSVQLKAFKKNSVRTAYLTRRLLNPVSAVWLSV